MSANGKDGNTYWFQGVVEDIHDPEKMGRVKVRCFGIHTNKTVLDPSTGRGIPTEDLPWAFVAQGTMSASMHGIGTSPHGLVEGSWVFGVSLDGMRYNTLLVLGSLSGMPTKKNPNQEGQNPPVGFFGQDGKYPAIENDEEGTDKFKGKPDVHMHAREEPEEGFDNEKWDSPHLRKNKEENRITGIKKALGGEWDEKESPYDGKYPHVKAFGTTSGHLIEIDDTPGAERIAIWFGPDNNTYLEIHPDGSIQIKSEKDIYSLALKDQNMYVKGELNISVDGDANIRSKNANIEVEEDANVEIGGKADIKAEENVIVESERGDLTLKSKKKVVLDSRVIQIKGMVR